MIDAGRAFHMGRSTAQRGGEVTEPDFGKLYSARTAEMLAGHFWEGVRDWKTFVANAIAKAPSKRTKEELEAIRIAMDDK